MVLRFTKGTLKVISSLLTNLSAGWLGSVVIFPGILKINNTSEFIILLTYSILFATLSMYFAARIENKLL